MKTIKMLVLGLTCIISLVDAKAQSIPIKINIAINRSKIQVFDYNLSMHYRSNKNYVRLKVVTRYGRLVAKIPKEDYYQSDSIEVILCEKANSRDVWISRCTTDHYIRPIFVITATTDKWPYSEIILYSTYPPSYNATKSKLKDFPEGL